MFRHKGNASKSEDNAEKHGKEIEKNKTEKEADEEKKRDGKPAVEPSLKELIEKNLKWSQIIYEQNRKINNKLLWSAVANWLRLLIILVPLGLAAWFLSPIAKQLYSTYQQFFGNQTTLDGQSTSFEQMLKLLPMNSAQQEQIKAILK